MLNIQSDENFSECAEVGMSQVRPKPEQDVCYGLLKLTSVGHVYLLHLCDKLCVGKQLLSNAISHFLML